MTEEQSQSIAKHVRNPDHRLVPPYISLLKEASWERYGFRCIATGVESPMMSGLARELYEHGVPFVVIDPQGNYCNLNELQDVACVVPNTEQWADTAAALLVTRPGLVVNLSGLEITEQQATCAVFLNSLIQCARRHRAPSQLTTDALGRLTLSTQRPETKFLAPSQDRPIILILDGASQLLYPQTEESEAFVAAKTIIKRGRAFGIHIMLCFDKFDNLDDTQNPHDVFYNNADVLLEGLPY